jgi:hypothetical protein
MVKMGEYSTLYIGGHRIEQWKNCIGEVATLFTEDDISYTPHPNWNDNWSYEEEDDSHQSLPCFQYVSTIRCLIDRLELLGYSLEAARQAWTEGVQSDLDFIREMVEGGFQPLPPIDHFEHSTSQNCYERWVQFYIDFTFEAWSALMKRIIEQKFEPIYLRQHEEQSKTLRENEPQLYYLLTNFVSGRYRFGFPTYDFNFILRAVLDVLDPDTSVVLDCSTLVGWVEPSQYSCAPPKTVVLTEGISDRRIIDGTLRLLYPHLHRYFTFIDFDAVDMPGSTSHLVNIIKAFVATGVIRPTVAIFDNDAAGHDALRQLEHVTLPDQIRAISLPYLDFATRYPTVGPQGRMEVDINGVACSLEVYLGRDILEEAPGKLTPVRFGGFMPGVQRWQGEILDKGAIHQRYMRFLEAANNDSNIMKEHDWTGMQLVLRTIFDYVKELHSIQESEVSSL